MHISQPARRTSLGHHFLLRQIFEQDTSWESFIWAHQTLLEHPYMPFPSHYGKRYSHLLRIMSALVMSGHVITNIQADVWAEMGKLRPLHQGAPTIEVITLGAWWLQHSLQPRACFPPSEGPFLPLQRCALPQVPAAAQPTLFKFILQHQANTC